MGFDVGIFCRGLQCGLGDSVGRRYGGVVGRGELGRGEVGRDEVGCGEVGHRLTAEVSGFWWVGSDRVWGGFLHYFFFPSLFDLSSCVWCGFCFWVCLICCADLSGYVCVCVCVCFFFKVALVDVGLCRWWLVGVVVAVVVGGCCCDNGGCAVVVVDGDEREKIIYYFNV